MARRWPYSSAPWSMVKAIGSRLDSYVDVTAHERDGRFLATADLGEDSRDVGVGATPQEALREALESLG